MKKKNNSDKTESALRAVYRIVAFLEHKARQDASAFEYMRKEIEKLLKEES